MNHRLKIPLLPLIAVLLQTGCGTDAAYTVESFESDSPFKLRVEGDIEEACESARRSLLGQGYLIDLASSEEVKARKAATVEGKQNALIEMNVVCVPEREGSTVFATGVLSTYDLKKDSSSASVGVAALGSISLPIGQSVDSLVKVSEQTIDDKEFYKRFFNALETILGEMRLREADDEPATAPAQESAAQEAGQPVSQPRIWPELFPEQGQSTVAPGTSSGQVAPEVLPVAAPASPTAPAPAPSAQQVETVITPVPSPVSAEPTTVAEPVEQQSAPTPAPNAVPAAIPATPVAAEAPVAVVPDAASAPTTPAATGSELAPIEVTAVRKATPKTVAPEQAAPQDGPQDPATRIDGLF